MRNCDSCVFFIKINWNDGRKGLCDGPTDGSVAYKKGKPCKDYRPKKYERRKNELQIRVLS